MTYSRSVFRPLHVFAALCLLALTACGGGGGGDNPSNPAPPSGSTVAISGRITFDRIAFKNAGQGLNPDQPVESPARGVVVEALSSTGTITSTSTDASGNYSLSVPVSTQVRIRAKAQMTKTGTAPTWDFRVLNNTNGDALYAIDGALTDSGTVASVRNLRAASGWNGSTYTSDVARTAAAFAILDTVYKAQTQVLSAVGTTAFPALNLYWSPQNKSSDAFCPDLGNILTSIYFTFDAGDTDQCTTPKTALEGIYLLGDFASGAGDTDEFDQHVIAHEFGHYLENKFSRSDSFGGNHSLGDVLDLRVAFGEGWGDAFSGMALNDPAYRDSQSGMNGETGFDLEEDASDPNPGWYSEASSFQILWDLFDGGTESGDNVSLGFTPIYNAFIGAEKTTDALTSIYSFSTALIAANSAQASGIRALLTRERIFGTGAFGDGETNFANKTVAPNTLNPTYTTIALNSPVSICGTRDFGTHNKLGNRRFLRLDLTTSRALQISAQGPMGGPPVTPAADPDIGLWRRGLIDSSDETGLTENFTTSVLTAGTYIIEVADFSHISTDDLTSRRGDTCMTVSVAGL